MSQMSKRLGTHLRGVSRKCKSTHLETLMWVWIINIKEFNTIGKCCSRIKELVSQMRVCDLIKLLRKNVFFS